MASIAQWRQAGANHLLPIAVAIIVAGAAGVVGTKARRATAELTTKRDLLQRATDAVANVQQQMRAPTPTETAALVAEAGRLSTLGVAESDRLELVDSIGRLAEANGLARVRVTARDRSDSLFFRPRTIVSQTLGPAAYELTLEFAGGFAEVVKFVSSLPPSVSVSRFIAARRDGQTAYQMVLSVYQLNVNESG